MSTAAARCPLSVAIVTLDEAHNLPRCLASVRAIAGEIVVVDSGSRDATREIARAAGARCVEQPWLGYAAQKNAALDACAQPWVLSLDADEEVSPELAASIAALLAGDDPPADGYEVCRRTWYLGDWIRHVWYPEWKLRLVRRGAARWEGEHLHERLVASGRPGRVHGDLLHYSYRDLAHHVDKSVAYAQAGARAAWARGRRFRAWRLVLAPPGAALRQLVLRQGWRDGWRGWVIAGATACRVFHREALLLEHELIARGKARDDHGRTP